MGPLYGELTSVLDSEVEESNESKPSEPLLAGGLIDRRLRVFLVSTASSGTSAGKVAVSAPGEFGSDRSFQGREGLLKCVECGLSVSSPTAFTAS
jgi:hypothetical protein